ncbi:MULTISPECIES: hypothetical protein [unclassified Blastococcus]
MDRNRYEADALADLEQQLFPPAVRRLRRRFCAATAGGAAGTAGAFALLGLRALPVLLLLLVGGGLVAVARITGPATAPPPAPAPPTAPAPPARPAQPRGCSTKS